MFNPFLSAFFNRNRAQATPAPSGGVLQTSDVPSPRQSLAPEPPPYPGTSYRQPRDIGEGFASIGQSIADAYAWNDWEASRGAPMQIMPPAQVQGMNAGGMFGGLAGFNPFGDPAPLPDLAARFGGQ